MGPRFPHPPESSGRKFRGAGGNRRNSDSGARCYRRKPAPTAESWTASVQVDGSAFCGGTLIDRKWVLTAFHCVGSGKRDIKDLRIRIGSRGTSEGGTLAKVKEMVKHPDASFTDGLFSGPDLVLLSLDRPVRHKLVRLNTVSPRTGTAVRALVWGNTCRDATCMPEHLQEITLPVSKKKDNLLVLKDRAFRGVGPGDSGGPLVVKKKGKWRLAGVTSTNGMREDHALSNFVDVAGYRDWIDKVVTHTR
ncbi:DUF1986 domain-containing protein [Streptomyces sp. 35G-GA-8]|uniref:S1 family peptidase n=1 Tax=Streptomyces sp. 35G-GA-8 TaxID=2939434 RepID=UPI0027E4FD83|nr:DUF1986 domain-containing protein [Streptomyces sp. 35G-GA-8]